MPLQSHFSIKNSVFYILVKININSNVIFEISVIINTILKLIFFTFFL